MEFIRSVKKHIRLASVLKKALLFFTPLFALLLIIAWIIFQFETKAYRQVLERNLINTIELQNKNIASDIKNIISDLLFLSGQSELEELFDRGNPIDEESLEDLNEEFLVFAKARRLYDQLRLLDDKGMEIVRINFNNGNPAIVPESKLQDKSKRYYFIETMRLNKGEIFMSPLDLNIENLEIETPPKPMIRFSCPVFDSQGRKRGMVILNYLGERLIQKFEKIDSMLPVPLMLLNNDGYWFIGPTPEDEWGFMHKNRKNRTFKHKFSVEWQRIQTADAGQFETDAGLFTFNTVYPYREAHESWEKNSAKPPPKDVKANIDTYKWKTVSHIPPPLLYKHSKKLTARIALMVAILSFLFLLGSIRFAYSSLIRKAALKLKQDLDTQILKTQKLESLNIMAGSVAHNFNNILMVVYSGMELALLEGIKDPAAQNIKVAMDETQRAIELSKMMLTYVGQGILKTEECDIDTLIEKEIQASRENIPGSVNVQVNLEPNLPKINGDPATLRQIFLNIFTNALEALENNQGTITIRSGILECGDEYLRYSQAMENLCPGPYVYVEAADTGVGMDEVTQARIFDPFYTTKFTGRGLGLAFVIGGVRSHKGFVKVDSKPNKGTTIRVLFPALS